MTPRIKVLSVVGTRPNFMKTAPVVAALRERPVEFEHVLVHTGQHYDDAMSEVFLQELGVGRPEYELAIGSGSHAHQTATVMQRLEPVLLETEPHIVLVPGDVNSTLAAALTAVKLGIPVGHIEAGLRSFDRSMPEEVNRVLTDQVSTLLFTHSPEAADHLAAEGIAADRVHPVGNTMIDTLVATRERITAARAPEAHGLERGSYLVVTLHRPALVDTRQLEEVLQELEELAHELPVVFPVHPRTRNAMKRSAVSTERVRLLPPLGYLEFLSLVEGAQGVLTDSGGIQEETTYLGVPCFTLRDNTERPLTVSVGTNTLLGRRPGRIAEVPALIKARRALSEGLPAGWDGRAADRIVDVLARARDHRNKLPSAFTPA